MSPTGTLVGVSRERVCEILSLAVWQVELAAEVGLLQKLDNGQLDPGSVDRARREGAGWLEALDAETRLDVTDAASRLRCSTKAFLRLATEKGLEPMLIAGKRGPGRYYRAADVDELVGEPVRQRQGRGVRRATGVDLAAIAREFRVNVSDVETAAATISARVQRGAGGAPFISASREHDLRQALGYATTGVGRKKAAESRDLAQIQDVKAAVHVHVRRRADNQMQVTLHLGPTNSGKTYDALQRLAETQSGVYAAPLRMLAREAYQKMCDLIGAQNVGLITGEEQVNPGAPVICCTAEMAPMSGTTLVLDEAHWAQDVDRGYAWTRLLVGGEYDVVEVAASRGAEVFLTSVFADAHTLSIQYHERLSPLSYSGEISIAGIPDSSLVVAFSRKGVHALARRLMDAGRTVGVLYGALPPEVRVEQIRRFMAGEVQVLVCTDVVGHGINTPAAAVVLAQTNKFDGTAVRDLDLWEAAQILGRAGRFGFGGAGRAFTLKGAAGFTASPAIVRAGADAAAGLTSDGLAIERGLLRPTFQDLGRPSSHQLGVALQSWAELAAVELIDEAGVQAVPVEPMIARWAAAADSIGIRVKPASLTDEWPLDGEMTWKVVTTPVDTESPAFAAFVRSLATNHDRFETVVRTASQMAGTNLDDAETAAGVARDLMVIARLFPDLRSGMYAEAAAIERRASSTIGKRLAEALRNSVYGICGDCGADCSPQFGRCDTCHNRS